MATMLLSEITTILTPLDIIDADPERKIVSGMRAAMAPRNSLLDGEWNHCGRDRFGRASRGLWRVALGVTSENGEVLFATIDDRRAA
jgi:hypothetical protein